jgi:hypothetical protein
MGRLLKGEKDKILWSSSSLVHDIARSILAGSRVPSSGRTGPDTLAPAPAPHLVCSSFTYKTHGQLDRVI